MTAAEQYINQLDRALAGTPKMRGRMLANVEDSLDDYMRAHPEATLKEIYGEYGEPKHVAAEVLQQTTDTQGAVRRLRFNRRLQWALALLVVLLVLMCVALFFEYATHSFPQENSAEVATNYRTLDSNGMSVNTKVTRTEGTVNGFVKYNVNVVYDISGIEISRQDLAVVYYCNGSTARIVSTSGNTDINKSSWTSGCEITQKTDGTVHWNSTVERVQDYNFSGSQYNVNLMQYNVELVLDCSADGSMQNFSVGRKTLSAK